MFHEAGYSPMFYQEQLKRYLEGRLEGDERKNKKENPNATPQKLRSLCEGVVDIFCNNFEIDGKDRIKKFIAEHSDAKFLISSSHLSNLDAPAAVKALGNDLNIQITAESLLFKPNMPQYYMFKMAGAENFSPISYKKIPGGGKKGIFSPSNLHEVTKKMESGKTPWMAAHPFTVEGEIPRAKIGPIYLAAKTGSYIIPTALEYKGPYRSLEGVAELLKGATGKVTGNNEAIYHIGEPINFGPIPGLEILEASETRDLTPEENETLKTVLAELRRRADILGEKIATMLPQENQGYYQKSEIRNS